MLLRGEVVERTWNTFSFTLGGVSKDFREKAMDGSGSAIKVETPGPYPMTIAGVEHILDAGLEVVLPSAKLTEQSLACLEAAADTDELTLELEPADSDIVQTRLLPGPPDDAT